MLEYWYILGTMYLIIMTWQDYKNNMKIDDRRNAFMLGLTISLISHVHNPFLYLLSLTLILMVLGVVVRKIPQMGGADINTINWILLGFGIISPVAIMVFFIVFSIITIIWLVLKRIILRTTAPTQFYGVILLSFVTSSFLYSFYFFG